MRRNKRQKKQSQKGERSPFWTAIEESPTLAEMKPRVLEPYETMFDIKFVSGKIGVGIYDPKIRTKIRKMRRIIIDQFRKDCELEKNRKIVTEDADVHASLASQKEKHMGYLYKFVSN